MAGAGAYQGAHAGPLDFFVASVMPFRQGAIGADPPGTFKSNTLTVVYLSPAAAQTTIQQSLPAQSGSARVNIDVGCPPNDPVCGFAAGMDVMVYDETASYDTFRITSAQGGIAAAAAHDARYAAVVRSRRQNRRGGEPHLLPEGGCAATDTYQLMHYDGVSSDVAVVDHVVGLTFEYLGEPFPPVLPETGDRSDRPVDHVWTAASAARRAVDRAIQPARTARFSSMRPDYSTFPG